MSCSTFFSILLSSDQTVSDADRLSLSGVLPVEGAGVCLSEAAVADGEVVSASWQRPTGHELNKISEARIAAENFFVLRSDLLISLSAFNAFLVL
jgi:hypothetical protein